MVANGDILVNADRAVQCPFLTVDEGVLKGVEKKGIKARVRPVSRTGRMVTATKDAVASVFISTRVEAVNVKNKFGGETHRRGNLITARMALSDLRNVANLANVAYVENGQGLNTPDTETAEIEGAEPSSDCRRVDELAEAHQYGKDVIVGVIDVEGFDFSHPDFLDENQQTRFGRIWDQGGSFRSHPKDSRFAYGSEILGQHMNVALKEAENLGVPAYEIEPQSSMVLGSHGTHVASIAAGNRGVARQAEIVGVMVAIPKGTIDRRSSFYDSTRLVDAIEYLVAYAQSCRKSLVINISLGTNGHAHDGSAAINRWIDALSVKPGVVVCVAAGNAGQERPLTPGDLGYLVGRIHASGRIASRGLSHDLEWDVAGNGQVDVSENEMEIWYGAQDQFEVSLRTPDGQWIGPVGIRKFVENKALVNGTRVSIYNELYHPANGANRISLFLSPQMGHGFIGMQTGRWIVRLHAIEVRDGTYSGWIERDDPRPVRRVGSTEQWHFPSCFSSRSFVDNSSINSLACGHRVVAVANYDAVAEKIHITSSQGPTRDGRSKPDVCASGSNVLAACGFAGKDSMWIQKTGSSMASPYVSGVAALMLGINQDLTAAQVEAAMRNTASPLPGGDYRWKNDAGYGRIDAAKCIVEAASINLLTDMTT